MESKLGKKPEPDKTSQSSERSKGKKKPATWAEVLAQSRASSTGPKPTSVRAHDAHEADTLRPPAGLNIEGEKTTKASVPASDKHGVSHMEDPDVIARAMQATRIGHQKRRPEVVRKASGVNTGEREKKNADFTSAGNSGEPIAQKSGNSTMGKDALKPRTTETKRPQEKPDIKIGKVPLNTPTLGQRFSSTEGTTTQHSAQASKKLDDSIIKQGLVRPPPLSTVSAPPMDMKALNLWIHPKAILEIYSYTTESPSAEEIKTSLAKVDGSELCRRCDKRFIFKEISRDKISEDNCVHHPGKFSVIMEGRKLFNGRPMKVWSCCLKRGYEPGCTTGPSHVVELHDVGRLAALCPFEATPEATSVNDESKIQKAIALDCEMSFTKYGLTVSRMTILSVPDAKTLVDSYIREPYPGIHFMDYNTRYSGVTHKNLYPEDPANSPPVLDGIVAAREKLWEYCDQNTIIIGHGLDHDLKCLRVLHTKIIDTAVLYSTRLGVKFRLKKLAEDELNWNIQDEMSSSTGHDSVEDCRTCIELVSKFLQRPKIAAASAASEVPD